MLTGESIPVIKQQLPNSDEVIYEESMTKHTVYSGTFVIQSNQVAGRDAIGLVKSTGFQTRKGNLVKDILFPKPYVFQFYRDVNKFIIVLFIIAIIGFLGTLPGIIKTIESRTERFQKLADSLTIAVPPSLPASLNFGIIFALARLRIKKIFCIQHERIVLAARIQLFVFDKTGTLTEEGLSVMGV